MKRQAPAGRRQGLAPSLPPVSPLRTAVRYSACCMDGGARGRCKNMPAWRQRQRCAGDTRGYGLQAEAQDQHSNYRLIDSLQGLHC
jgi:hypothetical protein